MSSDDLAHIYTALSEALGRAGPEKTALFLATLSLSLIARECEPAPVLDLIAQAERLSAR